ncbi:MAG: thiamine pyrophosphate-binding protein [Lautropia sp.]
MSESMTGARYIARLFSAYGVTHVFFMDAVLRRALAEMEDFGITRVLGHTEKSVAYMADGYARIAGRPGICMAQSVGAANLAAGLQDAYLGHSPVIALTGRHVAAMQYRNSYQEVEHGPLFAPVTKSSARVDVLEQLPHLIRQAFRAATSGTPRPVHLDVAGNTGDALTAQTCDFPVEADPAHLACPAFRPAPDPEALARAVRAIAESSRPVIVADRGVITSGAEQALRLFAERIQAPVVATLDAKAALPESHPLFRGLAGSYGRSCANHVIDEADLVIYAGSDTSDHTTANFRMPRPGTPIVQIDLDPEELGRNYPCTIGLLCDVRSGLAALAAGTPSGSRRSWLGQTLAHVEAWRDEWEPLRRADQIPMRPERLCAALTEVLPEDAILVADTGYAALWSGNLVDFRHPGQQYIRAAGSLGWSFPAALGAQFAAPGRTVVCFTGDGGFSYHLPELETARRWGLKTITIVNNNHCLSQGVRNLGLAYGTRPQDRMHECFLYRETDFAKIAQSFDCFGITVEDPRDFARAFAAARASNLPAVIDVKTEFAYQARTPWVPT